MRLALGLFTLLMLAAPPAAALDLPVARPGEPLPAGPFYRPDALTLRLAPAPARRAFQHAVAAPAPSRDARTALGLAGVDAAAASLGGARFTPMFAGRSGATDAETPLSDFYRVTLPEGADLESALARFAAEPEVLLAEPIPVVPVAAFPNDSLFPVSTWLYQLSRRDLHAPEAWAVGLGDPSVVVGVLDTGVIPYHPDLGGTVAGQYGQFATNPLELNGAPGIDDDGDGYVDDVAGWDFVTSATSGPLPTFEDGADADNDPNDFAGHGTMVAGVIAAIADNTIGVAGVAPGVRLLPLRVGWSTTSSPLGVVDMGYVAEAIAYGTARGAAVLNCSFATVSTTALDAAITAASRAGTTVVFAAGNNGQVHDEQLRGDVVAVAAVDATDKVASFSNLGSYVDVSAPGVGIRSTALFHSSPDSVGMRQPTYGQLDGTSFAAPMVSGGLALFESQRRQLGSRPLSSVNLALRLWDTADDIAAQNAGVTGYGGGRMNLERLLLDPPVSHAHRSAGRSVIPNVVLHERTGARVYWVATNRAFIASDAVTGDTLALATLPGGVGKQLAAADLGGGAGVGFFIGTTNGRMCGFGPRGSVLPGWPYVAASAFTQFTAGPAIGDLDGDGLLEIACGSSDGNVWAWRADGTLLDGFPVLAAAAGIAGSVALGEVDGQPGEEIVAAGKDGTVHAFRWDATEPAGWPATVAGAAPAVSPVIARFAGSARILVAGGTALEALGNDGSVLRSISLGGTVAQDMALSDFDGDGIDEIVVPLLGPASIAVLDSAGVPLASRNWPATLGASPTGPAVIGPLAAGVPQGVLVMAGTALAALSDSARLIGAFPKPGGAGTSPTLDELDGDGRTEVAAGAGPDSLFYVYDAGAGSWSPGSPWPTPRGDFARTGNHAVPRTLPVVDLTPPGAIADFRVDSLGAAGARLAWTAPGGDGAIGRAARYEINVTTLAGDAGRYRPGSVRGDAAPPDPAGSPQVYRITGLAPGASVFLAVRAVDSTGNVGASSAVVHVLSPLGPPRLSRGIDLAPERQPSARQVTWLWRLEGAAPGPRTLEIFDVLGRKLRSLSVSGGEEGALQWDGRDLAGRVVPAGLYFARLNSGSIHAQSRVVLLP